MSEHIPEHDFDRYLLGQMSEGDRTTLEEHLLICSPCRANLTATEDFIRTLRTVASQDKVRADRQENDPTATPASGMKRA